MSEVLIHQKILQTIKADKSLLPATPEVGVKILAAMDDPNCNVKVIAKVIKNDVGLSAFIIKTAGSSRFATLNPIKDLEGAIARMGLRETYHLSIAFLSRFVHKSSNRALQKQLLATHKFSTKMAVIAFFLANNTKKALPSQALLAGLFQDIGVPAILVALSKHPDVFNDETEKARCIDVLAPKIGTMILQQWGFEEDMIAVVKSRKNWLMDDEETGLPELVLIGRLHAMIGSPEFKECPSLCDIPAFEKLNLGELGPDGTLDILLNSQQEISDIQRSLGG
ncbi:MAG: metal-dependent hydrolase [Cycloclasticus sp. symbiont of Bathymodiolus heckerae]|nr:MAG: metal-dependent hydrolase [Cycloclasticus sp. symbiont of Bathymodiolus heckerae]